ncbi:DUF6904 family protein [uncultured Selenomonas sp.]|uniref:DUF6904 family protein n=1 Tax=uncultured Selenomonas sp. TaxID=159275 RepID=UPI0025E43105|nr:hypothetical protein [uncultured Selenomonas sp.]
MLKVKDTPKHLGACISGTYEDLDALHEALFDVIGTGESYRDGYDGKRTRMAGTLYDIRHAGMGDRGIEMIDSGVNPDCKGPDGTPLPKTSVVFSVPVLWPELAFFALATDDMAMNACTPKGLKDLCKGLPKEAAEAVQDRMESSGGLVKFFAALVWQEMTNVIGRRRAARIHRNDLFGSNMIFSGNCDRVMPHQYVDLLNIRYLKEAPEKRLMSLGKVARYLCDPYADKEYKPFLGALADAARKYDVPEDEIEAYRDEYPEEFDW